METSTLDRNSSIENATARPNIESLRGINANAQTVLDAKNEVLALIPRIEAAIAQIDGRLDVALKDIDKNRDAALKDITLNWSTALKDISINRSTALKDIQIARNSALEAIKSAAESAIAKIKALIAAQSRTADSRDLNRPPGWRPGQPS